MSSINILIHKKLPVYIPLLNIHKELMFHCLNAYPQITLYIPRAAIATLINIHINEITNSWINILFWEYFPSTSGNWDTPARIRAPAVDTGVNPATVPPMTTEAISAGYSCRDTAHSGDQCGEHHAQA